MIGVGLGGSHDLALFAGGGAASRSMLTLLAAALVLVIGVAFCALLNATSCSSDATARPSAAIERQEPILSSPQR